MSTHKAINLPKFIATFTQPSPTAKNLSQSAISQRISNTSHPLTYTFYHPNLAQSAVISPNNKKFQRRQYRFVSQSFSGDKLIATRPVQKKIQKQEKNDASSKNDGFKVLRHQFIEKPQQPVQEQNCYYTTPATDSAFSLEKELKDYPKVEVGRISSYESKIEITSTQKVQSVILKEENGQAESKPMIGQNQARYRGLILANQAYNINQNSLKCSITLVETPTQKLTSLHQNQSAALKLAKPHHSNIVPQISSSQSLNMPYQLKIQLLNQEKADLSQKYRKSEQSLKISRSIISTLNDKIARAARQNQTNLKNLEEKYLNDLLTQTSALRKVNEQDTKDNCVQTKLLLQQLQKSSAYIEIQTNQILKLRQQLALSLQTKKQSQIFQTLNGQLNQQINQQIESSQKQLSMHRQTIEQQKIKIAQLLKQAFTSKQFYEHLKLQNSQYQQQKHKRLELQQQLNESRQIIEQQRRSIELLNCEMMTQENDYRDIVEEEINKIAMIYSEQKTGLPQAQHLPIKSKSPATLPKTIFQNQWEEELVQNQSGERPREIQLGQFKHFSRFAFLNKIRQLQQANKSLSVQFQEINRMQEGLNDVIISKLKDFGEKLQKNEQQKHELQQKVVQLTQNLYIASQKCKHYEVEIKWVDKMYKQVQSNLLGTIQELLQLHAEFLDLKLQKETCYSLQNHQTQRITGESQLLEKEQQLTLGMQIYSQQTKKDLFIEEPDHLANYQIPEFQAECVSCNHYVKQAIYSESLQAIKVSQADLGAEQGIVERQQDGNNNLDPIQGSTDQTQQVYQRMSKTEERNQPQGHPSNSFSGFIKRIIKQLDQEEAEKTVPQVQDGSEALFEQINAQKNKMLNYILNKIKKLEQKDRQNDNADCQSHEYQKYQKQQVHKVNNRQIKKCEKQQL